MIKSIDPSFSWNEEQRRMIQDINLSKGIAKIRKADISVAKHELKRVQNSMRNEINMFLMSILEGSGVDVAKALSFENLYWKDDCLVAYAGSEVYSTAVELLQVSRIVGGSVEVLFNGTPMKASHEDTPVQVLNRWLEHRNTK